MMAVSAKEEEYVPEISLFDLHKKTPGRVIVDQRKHPYDDNADETYAVNIEGAAAVGVVFDPQTSTESEYGKK